MGVIIENHEKSILGFFIVWWIFIKLLRCLNNFQWLRIWKTFVHVLTRLKKIAKELIRTFYLSVCLTDNQPTDWMFNRLTQKRTDWLRRAPRGGEGGEYSPALIFDWHFVPHFILTMSYCVPYFDLICALFPWNYNSKRVIWNNLESIMSKNFQTAPTMVIPL